MTKRFKEIIIMLIVLTIIILLAGCISAEASQTSLLLTM